MQFATFYDTQKVHEQLINLKTSFIIFEWMATYQNPYAVSAKYSNNQCHYGSKKEPSVVKSVWHREYTCS